MKSIHQIITSAISLHKDPCNCDLLIPELVSSFLGLYGHLFYAAYAVTMQAQRVAPPETTCKDKFLIQSVVVPVGTTEEMITSTLVCIFSPFGLFKTLGNYMEVSILSFFSSVYQRW